MNSPEDATKKYSLGRPETHVWRYFNKNVTGSRGHYTATCNYCERSWARGKPEELQNHLASECNKCPGTIRDEFIEIVSNQTFKERKKKKRMNDQSHISDYMESTRLNDGKRNSINQALGRFFVTCSIPFAVVEHPFFVEFCKQLKPAYDPPGRTSLSNTILNSENARITIKINKELQKEENITIGKYFWLIKIFLLMQRSITYFCIDYFSC
jgi:hypothetical protein